MTQASSVPIFVIVSSLVYCVLHAEFHYPDRSLKSKGGVWIPHYLPWYALGHLVTFPSRASSFRSPSRLLTLHSIRVGNSFNICLLVSYAHTSATLKCPGHRSWKGVSEVHMISLGFHLAVWAYFHQDMVSLVSLSNC